MIRTSRIILLIAISSFITCNATGGIDNSQHTKEINMIFSIPQISDEGDCLTVTMDQATSYTTDPFQPSLPVWSISLPFPFGTHIDDVELSHTGVKEVTVTKRITPSMQPFPLGNHDTVGIQQMDENPQSGEPYPSQWYTFRTGGGIDKGKRITSLTIQVTPTRYLPSPGVLQFIDNISLKIKYHPSTISLGDEGPDLVIITPIYYYLEFIKLMAHKNALGLSTAIVTLDEIYDGTYFSVQGRDEQEQIKFFIKQAIDNWGTKYVLLGGGAQDIPVRESYISTIMPPEESFPSDLYYADVYDANGDFSTWDSNNNDLFGEYHYHNRTDHIDLYPDVYLGRLACDTVSQASTMVDKIIKYENTTFGRLWFKKIVVCAGDTFPGDTDMVNEGEYSTEKVVEIMSDFTPQKLWTSLENINKKDIRTAINYGAGFVDFSGHGSDVKWNTYYPGTLEKQVEFDMYDASLLTNRERLPIITINACSCGRFDEGDCLAWHFVKQPNGGAVAALASSGIAYGVEGRSQIERYMGWMETHFYEYCQENTGVHNLGIVWATTITEYLHRFITSDADYKTVEEWTLFGDPSLTIGGYSDPNDIPFELSKPQKGYIYSKDRVLVPTLLGHTLIIGDITLTVSTSPEISKVEFYIDDALKHTDTSAPFEWRWDDQAFFLYKITIIGYTANGETKFDSLDVRIFNINF